MRGARLQPVFLTLRVVFLLKLPSKMVWGPGPSLPPPPSLFMFLFTNWSGVLQGGRAALPSPWVSSGEFWLEPICSVGLNLPCHPTKDHTVK